MKVTTKELRQLVNACDSLAKYPTPQQRNFAEGVIKKWRHKLSRVEKGEYALFYVSYSELSEAIESWHGDQFTDDIAEHLMNI